MPNLKHLSHDRKKFLEVRNEQRKKYYHKTATFKKIKWTKEQECMVLAHKISDTELSKLTGHSVNAIQTRRSNLKKVKYNDMIFGVT